VAYKVATITFVLDQQGIKSILWF